uniref:Serine protease n=1 Tax=Globisporangium ultimum (strain ATCC 200006 / CBS 805.95 / DAOM BR144) TaxID=431595 RepID=K3XB24_GLOUD
MEFQRVVTSTSTSSVPPSNSAVLEVALRSLTHERSSLQTSNSSTNDNAISGPISIFPKQQAPQIRRLHESHALWMALNISECRLSEGDVLQLRDARGNVRVRIMTENASITEDAWKLSHLWDHPFLMQGDTVMVEYYPSLMTLMRPLPKQARAQPVVVVDSYVVGFPRLPRPRHGKGDDGDTDENATSLESTVGQANELKEAVCYRKKAPKMYCKSRAVARLLIRRDQEDPPYTSDQLGRTVKVSKASPSSGLGVSSNNKWNFCTGWLVGRNNHLMTNYHCIADLPSAITGDRSSSARVTLPQRGEHPGGKGVTNRSGVSSSASSLSSADGHLDNGTVAVSVNFMAETKSCQETGTMGEKAGVIEATNAAIVASSAVLDYTLLHIEPNDSSVDLARKYGYAVLRPAGPVDKEPILYPTASEWRAERDRVDKDGATCGDTRAFWNFDTTGRSSDDDDDASLRGPVSPNVFYTADTAPGSSGAPVFSQRDHTVVALHHAGGASAYSRAKDTSNSSTSASGINNYNVGIRIDLIIEDIRKQNALPPCALAIACTKNLTDPCCTFKW